MNVAIIGAGVAGLTLAKQLSRSGVDVRVFEKARALGGRITTKHLDWGQVDIGAQYFTARDQRFQSQVKLWLDEGVVSQWEFTPYRKTNSTLVASPDATPRYVGTPGMSCIGESLAKDLDIQLSTRIDHVYSSVEGWKLVCANGSEIKNHFDWVVVSAPAEQVPLLIKNSPLDIPIHQTVHQPCWALALATRGDVDNQIQGFFGDDIVSWVSRLSSRPNQIISNEFDDCWMLHFSSEWSNNNGRDTLVDIERLGFNWLIESLDNYAIEPLSLLHSYTHYWRYAKVIDTRVSQSYIINEENQIAVIGDWLNGGRVEGAYLSGLELSEHLIGH